MVWSFHSSLTELYLKGKKKKKLDCQMKNTLCLYLIVMCHSLTCTCVCLCVVLPFCCLDLYESTQTHVNREALCTRALHLSVPL